MRPHRLELPGRSLSLGPGETVLEALERHGVEHPSGCRSGSCLRCLVQGAPAPPGSQAGLRPSLREDGWFLACQARPEEDLRLAGTGEREPVSTTVTRVEALGPDIARLRLAPASPLAYRPGQFVDVLGPEGEARSYSLASLPRERELELHVRRVPAGRVSGWLHGLRPGAEVRVRGPFGQCFHVADDPRRKLVLAGAGTGLAPLVGIARDALEQGHSGPLVLVQGALRPERLYLREELAELERTWPNLEVHACVLENASSREHEGPLDRVSLALAGPLEGARGHFCGDPTLVAALRRTFFLAGMPSAELLADPFLPASGKADARGA